MKPRISVVMPVYNAEKYLSQAIESILIQTYTDFEFIIIDDGSTDTSLKISETYAQKDKRIVLVSRENKGLVASLNEGIALAKGEFIARMDADDISLPTRFEKQIAVLEQEKIDIIGCHAMIISETGRCFHSELVPTEEDFIILSLSVQIPFFHGSVMIRKSFLSKHQLRYGSNEMQAPYAEDYELYVKMYQAGAKFSNFSEFLFLYRVHGQSICRLNAKRIKKTHDKLILKFISNNKKVVETTFNRIISNHSVIPERLTSIEQENLFKLAFQLKKIKYIIAITKIIYKKKFLYLMLKKIYSWSSL